MHFITYFIFVVFSCKTPILSSFLVRVGKFSTPTRIPHSFIDTNKNLHGHGMTILFNLSIRPNFFLQKKPCLINDVTNPKSISSDMKIAANVTTAILTPPKSHKFTLTIFYRISSEVKCFFTTLIR
jgi:hypothetical protein